MDGAVSFHCLQGYNSSGVESRSRCSWQWLLASGNLASAAPFCNFCLLWCLRARLISSVTSNTIQKKVPGSLLISLSMASSMAFKRPSPGIGGGPLGVSSKICPMGIPSYPFPGGKKEYDEAVTENDENVLRQSSFCLWFLMNIFPHANNDISTQAASNSSHSVELLLQESGTHPSGGSIVVYATIDVDAVQVAMSGEDPSYIPLLPTGFVISPAAPASAIISNSSSCSGDGSASTIGCLLTIGMQVLASAVPSAKLNLSSVTAINNHLRNTVQQISAVLGGGAAVEPAAMPPEQ
ncbi:hypothetical protein BHM03_00026804 [Ensete ventricosum]|nr:hypothetical protein BHM03_00026804 [Ensete ventricosum]